MGQELRTLYLKNNSAMIHTYQVAGMTCGACEAKVKSALLSLEHITDVSISKEEESVTITMNEHIETEILQKVLGNKYQISIPGKSTVTNEKKACCSADSHSKAVKNTTGDQGKYYCPMQCEGDKFYNKAGTCPVCGMNLEKVPELTVNAISYTCPMHPEIIQDASWLVSHLRYGFSSLWNAQ
jgi:Cu+-exporting ATPase